MRQPKLYIPLIVRRQYYIVCKKRRIHKRDNSQNKVKNKYLRVGRGIIHFGSKFEKDRK